MTREPVVEVGAPADVVGFVEWVRPQLGVVGRLVGRLAVGAERDVVVQEALARAWSKHPRSKHPRSKHPRSKRAWGKQTLTERALSEPASSDQALSEQTWSERVSSERPRGKQVSGTQVAGNQDWSEQAQYGGSRTASGWLLAVVAEQALKAARRARSFGEFDEDGPLVSRPELDAQRDVDRALTSLTAAQRLAVDCYYFVGLSVADTAAVMRCSEETVKTTLVDARSRLRTLLEIPE